MSLNHDASGESTTDDVLRDAAVIPYYSWTVQKLASIRSTIIVSYYSISSPSKICDHLEGIKKTIGGDWRSCQKTILDLVENIASMYGLMQDQQEQELRESYKFILDLIQKLEGQRNTTNVGTNSDALVQASRLFKKEMNCILEQNLRQAWIVTGDDLLRLKFYCQHLMAHLGCVYIVSLCQPGKIFWANIFDGNSKLRKSYYLATKFRSTAAHVFEHTEGRVCSREKFLDCIKKIFQDIINPYFRKRTGDVWEKVFMRIKCYAISIYSILYTYI